MTIQSLWQTALCLIQLSLTLNLSFVLDRIVSSLESIPSYHLNGRWCCSGVERPSPLDSRALSLDHIVRLQQRSHFAPLALGLSLAACGMQAVERALTI